MLMSIEDLIIDRSKRGLNWPKKHTIYHWKHVNYYGFATRVIKKLGKKLLIDPVILDNWLNEVSKMDFRATQSNQSNPSS